MTQLSRMPGSFGLVIMRVRFAGTCVAVMVATHVLTNSAGSTAFRHRAAQFKLNLFRNKLTSNTTFANNPDKGDLIDMNNRQSVISYPQNANSTIVRIIRRESEV